MALKNIAETDLHQFWEKSEYFSHLLLSHSGSEIEIIRRGKANTDGGPDYRGIVIRIDGKITHGDCEIHISPLDWSRHGHQKDAAYNQTCLHLALDSVPAPQILLENGSPVEQILVPQRIFEEFLSRSRKKKNPIQPLNCALAQENSTVKIAILQTAGHKRLQQKSSYFAERYSAVSWDQLLYEGLCQALGYAKNTQPFCTLSRLVPIDLLFQEMRHTKILSAEKTAAALLFGAAGFLEPHPQAEFTSAEIAEYSRPLIKFWSHLRHVLQIQPMQRTQWQFFRLRPQNFPTRRIAGIAGLITKFQRLGILEYLLHDIKNDHLSKAEINNNLRQFFTVEADHYWCDHFDFKMRESSGRSSNLGMLIGKNRAADLVVNIVFPVLLFYAGETGDGKLQNKLLELYSSHPRLQENSITREMLRKTGFRKMPGGDSNYNVCMQQGFLHLAKNSCGANQCNRCLEIMLPFASREGEN